MKYFWDFNHKKTSIFKHLIYIQEYNLFDEDKGVSGHAVSFHLDKDSFRKFISPKEWIPFNSAYYGLEFYVTDETFKELKNSEDKSLYKSWDSRVS